MLGTCIFYAQYTTVVKLFSQSNTNQRIENQCQILPSKPAASEKLQHKSSNCSYKDDLENQVL